MLVVLLGVQRLDARAADFVRFPARLGKSEERENSGWSHGLGAPAKMSAMSKHDMNQMWEEHCKHEFTRRDVDATLDTMVEDAYVNHVPTLTGGVGKPALREFYARDFIPSMPPDTTLRPSSRTIGEDRLVDEMIFSFTHSQEIPWMLPGIPPTNRRIEIAMVAIVKFRDGKLEHEHIYWDQASALKQIGLLTDERSPVFGAETANRLLELKAETKKAML
jgi:carboxymethylenebutenolidase